MLENLHLTKRLGHESRDALLAGDLRKFAEIMHVHWEHKKKRSPGMSSSFIDAACRGLARSNGAIGGKPQSARAEEDFFCYTPRIKLVSALPSGTLDCAKCDCSSTSAAHPFWRILENSCYLWPYLPAVWQLASVR